ncbi:DoxX family protein [Streptomyces scopuliridis]|uniref:Membrane protein n=1 Tax=Streptomyces scopuliridis RB72 TaxID=1440053 RepID=A0A2T7TGB7_9ACTN|nr:DoxX family protein [Streptomyces scopuliridis]PVE14203.1 membrane protein [Streptomyces scopuliridis RB72]
MSVDTRTPRPGFDDQPPLSMLKVDCDPAQVIVNHASFRVKLATPQRPGAARAADTARIPAMSGGGGGGGGGARRRAPVVWSGKSAPGDPGASGLLQAVRNSSALPARGAYRETPGLPEVPGRGYDSGATQVIPRIDIEGETTVPTPVVGGSRATVPAPAGAPRTAATPLLPPMRQAVGAYDTAYDTDSRYHSRYDSGYDSAYDAPDEEPYELGLDPDERSLRHGAEGARAADAGVRHAYYPGRRMNLGVVLLPLRVFLGFISIYAGMGKLCDPVYFDGGERGSMVKWLNSLHPWALAEPLRDFALSHPVGAGLSVAFLQIVVGVLTVLGLWQRVAASVGALLSAALLLTVSWRTVPAYDAPDIIYLAAWSPLIIAGAPVYSVDGRLAGEAWRRLGPRSEIWELRRRVLRRGAVVATVVIGLTLLVGSVLGGAVRSSEMVTVPGPNVDPVNQLPGVPLPQKRGGGAGSASGTPDSGGAKGGTSSEPSATRSGSPTAPQTAPGGDGQVRESGGATTGTGRTQQPSQTQGTVQRPPQTAEQAPPPSSSQGPSSTGGTGDGSGGGSGSGSSGSGSGDGGSGTGGSSSGGGNRNPIGGLLG